MTGQTKVTVVGVVLSVLLLGSQGLGERIAFAGDLEPPGPPSPTMKTLEQTTGSWDQVLSADDGEADGCNSSRFTCVMGGAAVRDNETGLVWERSPGSPSQDWASAIGVCLSRHVGGRGGWRLPWAYELGSLVEFLNIGGIPFLPTGHPFNNIQTSFYWSATPAPVTTFARGVRFDNGEAGNREKLGVAQSVWCVRGGGASMEH